MYLILYQFSYLSYEFKGSETRIMNLEREHQMGISSPTKLLIKGTRGEVGELRGSAESGDGS